jgi:mycofactocin precursor
MTPPIMGRVNAPTQLEEASTDQDRAGTDSLDLVDEELLVEEISIDGMCGVY